MLAKTVPYWTVDSTTTDHIARDRNAFVDFLRIPKGSKTIYMGNNTSTDVLGIGTYKLVMRNGRTLFLHDVLYALEEVLFMLLFCYNLGLKLYLKKIV